LPLSSETAPTRRSARTSLRPAGGLRGLARRHTLLLLIVALFIAFSAMAPMTFPTVGNLQGLALGQSVSALLALAVLLVVVSGEFDLSVGYILGFSAVLTAKLSGDLGIPAVPAILIALVCSAAFGALSGILTTRFGVNSLIATLGIGLAVSGLSVGVSGGQTLSTGIPDLVKDLARTKILGIDSAIWIVVIVAIVIYLVLTRTPVGKKIYAVGGSEAVARMVGIRVHLVKISIFTLAATLAGLAGVLQLGLSGAANPSYGSGLLLPAFAAVFLGATTVRPGTFNVWGTVLAIVLLAIGFSGLSLLGLPFWIEPVFDGVALVIGVLLSRSTVRRVRRSRAKRGADRTGQLATGAADSNRKEFV
jgi:ribose transport system permease protein